MQQKLVYSVANPNSQYGGSASSTGGWGNPNSSTYAQDTYARITREMWADYQHRFYPYQQQYLSLAEGNQLLDEQLGRIGTNVQNAYGTAAQSREMMNQRYGINPGGMQQQSYQQNNAMAQALTTAQAKNATRENAEDRYFSAMEGNGHRAMSLNQVREGT
ncbi:hypothetical protein [Ferrimonas balearica]|uniref:hypothetical protein n=1 Tax=Ferrimonas balearica TaxID=44012 RepID=UPI001F46DF17|nr:hypothetical protein [Ferrimonas balearica]MBY6093863.1 hypothetical protein [Ferrimonas balearica]